MNALGLALLETLVRGRMLTVHREQSPSPTPLGCGSQIACRHQALFVRQRKVDPSFQRPERRRQAGEADDGVENDFRLRALQQLGQVAADLRQGCKTVDRL